MTEKKIPFTLEQICKLNEEHPTPFYIYDKKGIAKTTAHLNEAFAWANFKEYFAVKATPNPHILEIFKDKNCGLDCSSLAELVLAERSNFRGEDIMFSSNNTRIEEYKKALELDALINLDDITHIEFLKKHAYIPKTLSIRFNPGTNDGNDIIGIPRESKFGATKEQIFQAFEEFKRQGVEKMGLHTMMASNMLEPDYLVDTAKIMFSLVQEIYKKTGLKTDFVNLGGGFGIPYRPEEKELDITYLSSEIQKAYQERIEKSGLAPLKIYLENGRYMTGPHGYLVTKVLHYKETYKTYIGVDASMANLMRPGMYNAYHHACVLGKEKQNSRITADIVGSLCENCDKFAIDRSIPKPEINDYIIILDAGAHAHAMGFNYNGKLRCAEFFLKENGTFAMIRRRETLDDYFSTLNFD